MTKIKNKAQGKLNTIVSSQVDASVQSLNDNPLPRIEEIGKVMGKRKAPQPQATEAHREKSKSFLSHHSKSSDGKSSKGNRPRSKTNQRAKEGVGNQLGGVGPRKWEPTRCILIPQLLPLRSRIL